MPNQTVFHETYTGPRWTYGLNARPLDIGTVPRGWIIGSHRGHSGFQYGAVDYPFELTDDQVRTYGLIWLGMADDTTTIQVLGGDE